MTEILQKIKIIEKKAAEIVTSMQQQSTVRINNKIEDLEQAIQTFIHKTKKDGQETIRKAQSQAIEQAKQIEADTLKEISALNTKTQTKIAPAKKEILKWL